MAVRSLRHSLGGAFVHDDTAEINVVHVVGDVDIANSKQFEEMLMKGDAGRGLVVNLTECSYIDSTGLSVLVRAKRRLGDAFSVIAHPEGMVRRILELTQLWKVLAAATPAESVA